MAQRSSAPHPTNQRPVNMISSNVISEKDAAKIDKVAQRLALLNLTKQDNLPEGSMTAPSCTSTAFQPYSALVLPPMQPQPTSGAISKMPQRPYSVGTLQAAPPTRPLSRYFVPIVPQRPTWSPHQYRPFIPTTSVRMVSSEPTVAFVQFRPVMRHEMLPRRAFCEFCRKNRETRKVYESHMLKDEFGNVVCPQLRTYTCKLCGATGDEAHTEGHCRLRDPGAPKSLMQIETKRLASGRLRKK